MAEEQIELPPEEIERRRVLRHLQSIQRHIKEVQKNCELLAERIIDKGGEQNFMFGRELIANGFVHDNSKLVGVEWKYLVRGDDHLPLAHEQHVSTNPHHPEYWTGKGMTINEMPSIYVAEMVCDWKARSSEFGSDLRSWVKDTALDRFEIKRNGKKYKEIKSYLDLLLDDPF